MEGGTLRIEARTDGPGVTIIDPIERKRVVIETDRPVSPSDAPTDQFVAPVDSAVSVDVDTLQEEYGALVYVRDEEGSLLTDIPAGRTESFPPDSYVIEANRPVKVYLRVEGPMTIEVKVDHMEIDLEEADLTIGARSLHRRPAAVIETTSRPSDLRDAVSMLSSSLKTMSPERSFPTLRGHPPDIEMGDTYSVPPELERPETGIQLEITEDIASIFEAAPLAFYLGAELVFGPTPRLSTSSGWEYPLEGDGRFHEHIERVLKQVFLLDCVVRTEGLYPVELHEREELEPDLGLDLSTVYDLPIRDRLERYLEVSYETVAPHVPRWQSTAHLPPTPEHVGVLPIALDDLSLVRVESPGTRRKDPPPGSNPGEFETPLFRALSEFGEDEPLLEIDSTNSFEDTWFGDGVPLHGSMGSTQAHQNRLERQPTEGPISVTVVQNDPVMTAEGRIDAVYGTQTALPFDVTRYENLTRAELRSVLQESSEFIHFIGHVTDEGLQCADGFLDTRTLESVGIDSFLLNACQSYEQGRGLVQGGAVGGVVTINDVVNTEAVTMGETLAHLLDAGFHLGAALQIASEESVIGDLYKVIGDSGVQIAQTESGSPVLPVLNTTEGGIRVQLESYPTTQMGMGSLVYPSTSNSDRQHLISGTIEAESPSPENIRDLLELENQPLRIDGELHWRGDIELSDLQ